MKTASYAGWHALSLRRAWRLSEVAHTLPFVQGLPPADLSRSVAASLKLAPRLLRTSARWDRKGLPLSSTPSAEKNDFRNTDRPAVCRRATVCDSSTGPDRQGRKIRSMTWQIAFDGISPKTLRC